MRERHNSNGHHRKHVLLDRDGVINRHVPAGYVTSWDLFRARRPALSGTAAHTPRWCCQSARVGGLLNDLMLGVSCSEYSPAGNILGFTATAIMRKGSLVCVSRPRQVVRARYRFTSKPYCGDSQEADQHESGAALHPHCAAMLPTHVPDGAPGDRNLCKPELIACRPVRCKSRAGAVMTSSAELVTERFSPPSPLPPADDPRYFPKPFDDFLTATYSGTDPIGTSHRNYMRTDIERGREAAKQLQPWISIQGKRVLDVGCGYGGILLAMADAGAASIAGVEVDAERLHWAKERTDAIGFPADLRVADICVEADVRKLPSYDVILMQDVMEHVADPSTAIRHISGLLAPGGAVYVQVGNKFSADQLLHDHHCQLPGLTVLSREQAV